MRLQGRISLVTGGGGHVGRATSLKLASEGAIVIVNDIVAEKAEVVAREICETGAVAKALAFDVTNTDDVEKIIGTLVREMGHIDILVNIAGGPKNNLVSQLTEEEWDYAVDLNLKGSFNCIRAVVKHMIPRHYGRIVNTSSTSTFGVPWFAHIGQSNYAAANAGLIGLTRSLAHELGPHGININCVVPGPIETPKSKAAFDRLERDPMVKVSPLRLIPLGRLAKPVDVANGITFLVSDEADYITGAFLHICGGLV